MIKGISIGCVVLLLIIVLGIYGLMVFAIHYALAQIFPTWEAWILWVLSFVIASALSGMANAGARHSRN